MTDRILQIVFKVGLLKSEYSEPEILKAVKILEEQGISSELLAYLASKNKKTITSKVTHRKKQPVEEQHSEILMDLKNKDPEKYDLLKKFNSLLRQGEILPKVNEIKKLGNQLSKDFSAKNSRTDMINKLVSVLVSYPIEQIKEIVQNALTPANLQDSPYLQLSKFLITGKVDENSTSE